MKKLLSAVLAVALSMSPSSASPRASAATEFGSGCAADGFAPFQSLVSVAHGPTSPLPVAAPSAGVITEWKLNVELSELTPEERAELANAVAQQLLVLRPAGPDHYTVVGRSGAARWTSAGSAPTPRTSRCSRAIFSACRVPSRSSAKHRPRGRGRAVLRQLTGRGDGRNRAPASEAQVPVVAKIEPDVDSDGAGDETQDKCPQSPNYQSPCPVVTINSKPTAGKKAVTLYVATSLRRSGSRPPPTSARAGRRR